MIKNIYFFTRLTDEPLIADSKLNSFHIVPH